LLVESELMRTLLAAAAIAASLGAATAAQASAIVALSPSGLSSLSSVALTGTEDLRNNKTYASGSFLFLGPFKAYLFDEGVNNGLHSYLLHYDRGGGVTSVGGVSGSFQIQLGGNELFQVLADNATDLLATDPANGVKYQTAGGLATSLRGVELFDTYGWSQAGNLVTVNYALGTDGLALDEVRFATLASPTPEASTWALLIGGLGMTGVALRRRRTLAVA
jgi:hypothetical protein